MGVPGLWRILDLASQPITLDFYSGFRVSIDINSHLNRILHGSSSKNWLFVVMRDLFSVMHFNIRIVVVFQGERPNRNMFSFLFGNESDSSAYYRVRSALVRASENPVNLDNKAPEPASEIPVSPKAIKTIPATKAHLESLSIEEFAVSQLNKVASKDDLKKSVILQKPQFSDPIILDYHKNSRNNGFQTKKLGFSASNDGEKAENNDFLDGIEELLKDEDPSSEQMIDIVDDKPCALLPTDEILAPVENYVTSEHLRILSELLDLIGVPYIHAPEEATAECARLEMNGFVDAVASDDNNAILFGSRILIRNVFFRPNSITLESLEKIGLSRKRLLMLSMMIDGDYNHDIRRRLFTVGPIRGLEILSFFPDEKIGLLQFKEWWIRVIKNSGDEDRGDYKLFSKKKWIRKLVVPNDFPPEDLYQGFLTPKVGNSIPNIRLPSPDGEKLFSLIRKTTTIRESRIKEIVDSFLKRCKDLVIENKLDKYTINSVSIPERIQPFVDRIMSFDGITNSQKPELSFLTSSDDMEDISIGTDSIEE